jgi:hypothetical protein
LIEAVLARFAADREAVNAFVARPLDLSFGD